MQILHFMVIHLIAHAGELLIAYDLAITRAQHAPVVVAAHAQHRRLAPTPRTTVGTATT